jgi:hypothetical protein
VVDLKEEQVEFDWTSVVQQLSTITTFDYLKKGAMPEFVEPLVEQLIEYLASCTDPVRQQLLSTAPHEMFPGVGWYAQKLVRRAVRNNSKENLWHGLLALAFCAKVDPRDVMRTLALYNNGALRLGEDPKALIERAGNTSTPLVARYFTAFVNAPPEHRFLSKWQFSEGTGPHGFDYIPLMPEDGGPTVFD